MFNHKIKNNPVHTLIMDQINDVENCLIQFESFIRASSAPNVSFDTLGTLAKGISDAEAVADISLRKMIDSLGGSSFLTATRQDLISIATGCDAIANKCESYAKMSVFQSFVFPGEYSEDLLKIISISREQFDVLRKSISLLFSDFGTLLKDHSILDEIRKYESQVDTIEESLYERIFKMDITLAEKMQMREFADHIAELSDIIENLADKIQIMLVTRKA
jgi:predicted phosphate transport protein (TIGR00153 family)